MKKRTEITIVSLLAVNALAVIFLGYVTWRCIFWKQEALMVADFAGKVLAASNYAKGKHIKFRLVVKEEAANHSRQRTEFEGPYVVRDWVGFTDPLLNDENSPSIRVARRLVEAHNGRMAKIMADPEGHKAWSAGEIVYWQEEVLGKSAGPATGTEKDSR